MVLRATLARTFDVTDLSHAVLGVEVKSTSTGEVLFSRNPSTLLMPASNMKIVTLAAAAERLGWGYRFHTTLVSTAPIENGVLKGDLVVVGSGDPSIEEREGRALRLFDEWAAALRAAGVSTIDGALVGDDRMFDAQGLGRGWSWDYLAYGYAASVSALQFERNVVRLRLAAGASPGDPVRVDMEPEGSGLTLASSVVTGPPDGQTSLDLHRLPGQSTLTLSGSVPAGVDPFVQTASVDDPSMYFVRAARAALVRRGIGIHGAAVLMDRTSDPNRLSSGTRIFVSSESPPLSEIAVTLMKESQNLYAETLLKTLGCNGGPGSAAAGAAAVRETLAAWGLSGDYVQVDGSGLSRYDYLTAEILVGVLERMYADPRHRTSFLATLPVAGRDGTLAGRLKGTAAEGTVLAKTGSISNARALSGFVTTRDGEVLVFSIIANNFSVPAATVDAAIDAAVQALAGFSRREGSGSAPLTPGAPLRSGASSPPR